MLASGIPPKHCNFESVPITYRNKLLFNMVDIQLTVVINDVHNYFASLHADPFHSDTL